jgi:hypothetical protein
LPASRSFGPPEVRTKKLIIHALPEGITVPPEGGLQGGLQCEKGGDSYEWH